MEKNQDFEIFVNETRDLMRANFDWLLRLEAQKRSPAELNFLTRSICELENVLLEAKRYVNKIVTKAESSTFLKNVEDGDQKNRLGLKIPEGFEDESLKMNALVRSDSNFGLEMLNQPHINDENLPYIQMERTFSFRGSFDSFF